jgi:heterodisulfide reductase subunit A
VIDRVSNHDRIRVHLKTRVKTVDGFVGQYKTTLENSGSAPEEILHGVAIIATGGKESKPQEYLYGEDERVKTGQEFEQLLHETPSEQLPERVVFIQCVGSREGDHMYCSRICCRETIKNALALKKRKPSAEIYVLYRDMRTYGFSERYYQEAREAVILFLRYDEEHKPTVSRRGKGLAVKVQDLCTDEQIVIQPENIVLASRIDAEPENEAISQAFKVPLNQDGFFLEAHVKLRPVDFATDGVFLAGMAHNPKTIEESVAQGRAAAARAATIISKDKYLAEATIAAVNEDLCDGCGICVGVCEYNALEIEEKPDKTQAEPSSGTKIVKLNEAACKGCGCCVAACPSGAMEQKGYKSEQIMAEIDAALV